MYLVSGYHGSRLHVLTIIHVVVTAPIRHLERLLDTTFEEYSQAVPESNHHPPERFFRAQQHSLPVELVPHVHCVFETVDFPPTLSKQPITQQTWKRHEKLSNSHLRTASKSVHPLHDGYVTPAVLNSYYNITSNRGSESVAQAVYGAMDQTLSLHDLSLFQTTYTLPQQSTIAESIGK